MTAIVIKCKQCKLMVVTNTVNEIIQAFKRSKMIRCQLPSNCIWRLLISTRQPRQTTDADFFTNRSTAVNYIELICYAVLAYAVHNHIKSIFLLPLPSFLTLNSQLLHNFACFCVLITLISDICQTTRCP